MIWRIKKDEFAGRDESCLLLPAQPVRHALLQSTVDGWLQLVIERFFKVVQALFAVHILRLKIGADVT